jgi:hypothetical protein
VFLHALEGVSMSAYDLVRVRDGDQEFTVSRAYAEAQGLTVVNTQALDEFGRPAAAKPVVDKAGRPAAPVKEG